MLKGGKYYGKNIKGKGHLNAEEIRVATEMWLVCASVRN